MSTKYFLAVFKITQLRLRKNKQEHLRRCYLIFVLVICGVLAACGGGDVGVTESGSTATSTVKSSALQIQILEQPQALTVVNSVQGLPVYRFAKISNGAYFFTGNEAEKNLVLSSYPDFRYEGVGFYQSDAATGVPVYRFANLTNGGYFYTANVAERDLVINTRPDLRFESSTFAVAQADAVLTFPVYRLANLRNGAYLYTTSAVERDAAVALGFWRNEGVAFYSLNPDVAPLQVSRISSAADLSYGKTATLLVQGTGLNQGVVLTAPGCSSLSELAGGSSSQRSYSCKVAVATSLSVNTVNAGGLALLSATLTVPDPQVTMVTSLGTLVYELNPAKAPISVDNFLKYTNDGFYSNTIFHRVVPNFVVQGGGYTTARVQKAATYPAIVLESNNGLSNVRGSLAMARTSVPDSATSQFYINTVDNLGLNYVNASNPGYAVFGKVVQGLTVVDAINAVPTNTSTQFPLTNVVVQSAAQTR